MRYDPNEAVACLPAGTYPAALAKAEEVVSKAGNDMIVLTFTVYRDGSETTIKDYAVVPKTLYRLKRLAQALNCLPAFESGDTDWIQKQIGSTLRVELEVESDVKYGDQNRIAAYLPSDGTAPARRPVNQPSPDDETVPF